MDPPQDLGEIGPWMGGGFQSVTPDPQLRPHLELMRTQVLRLRPCTYGTPQGGWGLASSLGGAFPQGVGTTALSHG